MNFGFQLITVIGGRWGTINILQRLLKKQLKQLIKGKFKYYNTDKMLKNIQTTAQCI